MAIFHHLFLIACNFVIFHRNKFLSFTPVKFKYLFTQNFKKNCQNLLQNIENHNGKVWRNMVLCDETLIANQTSVSVYMNKLFTKKGYSANVNYLNNSKDTQRLHQAVREITITACMKIPARGREPTVLNVKIKVEPLVFPNILIVPNAHLMFQDSLCLCFVVLYSPGL